MGQRVCKTNRFNKNSLATPASGDILVNEKTPTQEASNEIRHGNQEPAAEGKPARVAAPAVRGETSGDAGGRGSALQPTGARSDSGNVNRPAQRSDVSGSGRTEEHAGNGGQGDNKQRPDRVRPGTQGLTFRISGSYCRHKTKPLSMVSRAAFLRSTVLSCGQGLQRSGQVLDQYQANYLY